MDRGVKNVIFCGRHKWMVPTGKTIYQFMENFGLRRFITTGIDMGKTIYLASDGPGSDFLTLGLLY